MVKPYKRFQRQGLVKTKQKQKKQRGSTVAVNLTLVAWLVVEIINSDIVDFASGVNF